MKGSIDDLIDGKQVRLFPKPTWPHQVVADELGPGCDERGYCRVETIPPGANPQDPSASANYVN